MHRKYCRCTTFAAGCRRPAAALLTIILPLQPLARPLFSWLLYDNNPQCNKYLTSNITNYNTQLLTLFLNFRIPRIPHIMYSLFDFISQQRQGFSTVHQSLIILNRQYLWKVSDRSRVLEIFFQLVWFGDGFSQKEFSSYTKTYLLAICKFAWGRFR